MRNDICRLCGTESILKISHIIPKFVYDWLKDTSTTGRIRTIPNINKPVQDGLKLPWLCHKCENKLSKFETYFAKNVFYPLINDSSIVKYEEYFLKACVSISWRVLKYFFITGQVEKFPEEIKKSIIGALDVWRKFILDERSNPGEFEQHFFNFNGEISGYNLMSPNIHRYLQRTIDYNVIHNNKVALVYTKLPNFLLIGYIKCTSLGEWRATRVHVKKGILQPCKYSFPSELFEFIEFRSNLVDELKKSISKKQQNKINDIYIKKADRVTKSSTWQSLIRDIELFGEEKVFKKNEN